MRAEVAGSEVAKAAILLAAVLAATVAATVALAAVTAAPAVAQTSGNSPDYALEEDGTVVIDGDMATDCASFASFLEQGYFKSGDTPSAGARRVLEQCEEAGLLDTGGSTPSASASGEGGGLPETGGPFLPALLVVSVAVVAASGLLAKIVR